MMPYTIVVEKSGTGFGAYVPELPGCVAVAETEAAVRELIREAIEFHLDGMVAQDVVPPRPRPPSRR